MKRYYLIIFLFFGLIMGATNVKSNPDKTNEEESPKILGMVLLEEPNSLKIPDVINELEEKWNIEISEADTSEEVSVLMIDGYIIAIANMPVAIPGNEIKTTAEINYFWENGVEEATKHTGHILIMIMNSGDNRLKENLLFNKVATSVINNSKSIGIYLGNRSLLLKKDFYLKNSEIMNDNNLPIYTWIYFGMRVRDGKQSIYTYGLTDFDKKEIEILDSEHSLDELHELIYDIVHYVLAYDVILKDGETIGTTAEQKLKISESEGEFLDGTTFKIEY